MFDIKPTDIFGKSIKYIASLSFLPPMICKVIFNKEIHLLTSLSTYSQLLLLIRQKFSHLPRDIQMTYQDSDNEQFMLSSQEDFKKFRQANTATQHFPKIQIKRRTVCKTPFAEDSFEVLKEESENDIESSMSKCMETESDDGHHIELTDRFQGETWDQQDSEIIWSVSRDDISKQQAKILTVLIKEEGELIAQLTRNFIFGLLNKVVKEVLDHSFSSHEEFPKQNIEETVSFNPQNHKTVHEIDFDERLLGKNTNQDFQGGAIDRLVERKINELMPSIIQGVSSTIQQRLKSTDWFSTESKYNYCPLSRAAYRKGNSKNYL